MAEEGENKLSKKELKRLAKQADKKSNKSEAKAAEKGAPAKDAKNAAPEVQKPKKAVFFLANASKDECASSLKASIAAAAFGVPLARASAVHKLPSIFSGPAIFNGMNPSVVAFGGNGIAKAIALIGSHDNGNSAVVDEWLELERTSLRKCASGKTKAAALAKVEAALTSGCGSFLAGGSLSVADIAVVVALSQESGEYSDVVKHYIKAHMASPAFISGAEALAGLVPPPPFDMKNDPSLMGAVDSVFHTAIASLVPELAHTLGQVAEKSKVLKNGDYQCKEAMPLFAELKASGSLPESINSPQQLAQAIMKNIPENNPVIDTIVMNGPGFILCKVKASYLEHHVNSLMNSSEDGSDPKLALSNTVANKGENVVVDFSSPNIAKEMHVGHLRSTIIGESVCRILEYVGANVKRVNHVGDWGTQFGMLITFLKESYPDFGKGADVDIGDLTQFYKKSKVSLLTIDIVMFHQIK